MAKELYGYRFAEWLDERLEEMGSDRSRMRAAMDMKPQTVNQWSARGTQPSPPQCWKVSRYLKVPLSRVLQVAGHIPDDEDVSSDEDEIIPPLRAALAEFTLQEQREVCLPAIRVALVIAQERRAEGSSSDPQ